MLSQFFVLSARGDTLVFKDYRGDAVRGTAEMFFRKYKSWVNSEPPPAFNIESIQFLYIRRNGLLFVCTTKFNVSPAFVTDLLNRIANVFKDYCGVLNEESLRLNFVLVYELLDEMLDFGYPQGTSTEMLKTFVYNTPAVVESDSSATNIVADAITRVTTANPGSERVTVSSNAPNKPIAVRYDQARLRRNEVFIDLIERLTVLVASNGNVLRSEIDGSLQMKSFLAGEPQIRVGFNEDLIVKSSLPEGGSGSLGFGLKAQGPVLDDCNFHERVALGRFEDDRSLIFTPPEGEFTVMNYRITTEFPIPFRVIPFVEQASNTRLDLILKLRCEAPSNIAAGNMVVAIPLPKATTSCSFEIAHGVGQAAEFKPNDKLVLWSLRRVNGGTEQSIRCKLLVPDASQAQTLKREMGPVTVSFEMPMFICSGLQIRYLKIVEKTSTYSPYRWVRYVTTSDSYVCRI